MTAVGWGGAGRMAAGLLVLVASALLWLALSGRSNPYAAPASSEIVFSEFQGDRSLLWAAPAENVQNRRQLASIAHHPGVGIRARLSPDGSHIAVLSLPPNGRDPATSSTLAALGLTPRPPLHASAWRGGEGGEAPLSPQSSVLSTDADLLGTPLWSPDGSRVLYRKVTSRSDSEERFALVVVDLADPMRRRAFPAPDDTLWISPFAWRDDQVYAARFGGGSADLIRLDVASGRFEAPVRLSDAPARDFALSPAGDRVLFSVTLPAGRSQVVAAAVNGSGATVLHDGPGEAPSPIWSVDGRRVTLSSGAGGALRALAVDQGSAVEVLSAARPGETDLPLGWSSDGRFIAVRTLSGPLSQPSQEWLVIVAPGDGRRQPVPSSGPVQFVGWLAR